MKKYNKKLSKIEYEIKSGKRTFVVRGLKDIGDTEYSFIVFDKKTKELITGDKINGKLFEGIVKCQEKK